jgi:hypothetical protein
MKQSESSGLATLRWRVLPGHAFPQFALNGTSDHDRCCRVRLLTEWSQLVYVRVSASSGRVSWAPIRERSMRFRSAGIDPASVEDEIVAN